MSADASAESSASQNLNLTPEEKRAYGQLFRQADTDGVGVVTGDVAVKFFEKTRLDSRILGEIWQIADSENRGFLTPAGFGVVLRLIGHAQAGREPTAEVALQPGPIPRFDGIWPPSMGSPTPGSPAPIQAQGTGGAIRIPPLTPDKVAQYTSLFERQPLQANKLPGEQARQIFDKSGMPNETLGRIWALADTEQRGALVLPEFIIAMHLLTSMKTGTLRSLPHVLPAGLYEAATQRAGAARQSPGPIPRQLSGTAQMRTGSPLGRAPVGTQAGGDWAVTPAEKAKFDQIYTTIDKSNRGFITGEEAVPFLSQSNLSEDALAQIWDLADFNSTGQLTREGFAIAMYLIRQQRSGSAGPLPSTLPPNLVPPSVRSQRQTPAPFPAPTATRPPPPQPKSAIDDLFGLDSTSSSPAPPAPMQTTMSTGGSNSNDPFAGGSAILPPSSPIRAPATGNTFKPFVPSSSFGRGLTGPSGGDTPKTEDLLEDNDPEGSRKITGETTELANLSSQIGTLSKQMQDVQNKRTTTQNELNQTNSQKQNFEQRLAQLRTLYEKEAEDTRSLEAQLKNSRTETQKLQSECMTLEGTYKDIQTQHQQMLAALQADQQENTSLRERIRVVNAEIAQLKPQIEKLKSEGRQQKGLVAINKKQLVTTEGERDKLKTEAESLVAGGEEVPREAGANSPPVSTSAQVASPALSTGSGNNPFFKRTASTDIMGAFASPPSRSYTDKSLDDVFGPSFAGSSSSPPPPPAAFQPQHTGASAASGGSFSNTGRSSPSVSRQGTMNMEPPAPPASRQISSSFLPFPDKPESLSSSRQVSPPASRVDGPTAASSAGEASSSRDLTSGAEMQKNENSGATDAGNDVSTTSAGETPSAAKVEEPTTATKQLDPFGGADQAKAKADFDNAFAAFTTSGQSITAGETDAKKSTDDAFNTEFPPISHLERDDESDSDSEQGGFDDDFAPASPPTKGNTQEAAATEAKTIEEVTSTAPPAVPAKEPVGGTNNASEQPASPATVTNSSQPTLNADEIFGATGAVPAKLSGNGVFDDLEDDFEGLEDAKEGSADDDFANISRDDFNPVFDGSPPASQTKSESTAFGNESTFDFVSRSSAAGSATQQKTADSHDWDAIFSGLDSPGNTTPPASGLNVDGSGDKGDRPPPPGRALTEQGDHDDPILKSLTGMGYSRADAVASLEKYDYNLEKAANYLASKS